VAQVHDSVLERIDWRSFLNSLRPDNRAAVEEKLRIYHSGLWRFFDLPAEPLCL
jgi:hypothetical protein